MALGAGESGRTNTGRDSHALRGRDGHRKVLAGPRSSTSVWLLSQQTYWLSLSLLCQ